MKKIPLTKGQFAIIDNEDYEKLSKYKWCVQQSKKDLTSYACRWERGWSKKYGKPRKVIQMANMILTCPKDYEIDHINHNGLDNRKENLRVVTRKENNDNRRTWGTSQYKGVYWDKLRNKWRAGIVFQRKLIYLGRFNDEIDAAKVYDKKVKELFGEYASTNF